VSKDWYVDMLCDKCHERFGYYIDCGPGSGVAICPSCYEDEPDTEGEDDDE
jgi:hypothetical protein